MELLVYKASAGSGKTFTLAVEYIKHLVIDQRAYQQILAVTFTNKATAEMKDRILQQLYGIWKKHPASESYLKCIGEKLEEQSTPLPEDEIRRRCGTALLNMLHDYSRFRVETIDSFFQSVIRNLARELELNHNLNIELDNVAVLNDAVDSMIEKLTPSSPVLTWLLNYIDERIADDKRWNIADELKSFGRNIFDENYVERGELLRTKLQNAELIPTYKKILREAEDKALDSMKECQTQFEHILSEHNLTPNDLKNGAKGIGSYFRKLYDGKLKDKDVLNATLNACLSDAQSWASKTSARRTDIVALAEKSLMPLLAQAEKIRPAKNQTINSCRLSLQHLNQLQLLNHIDEEVRTLNRENNRFLLSDTNALLHKLMGQGDSSFVFEKLGSNIRTIMIDEFQDTSRMQWGNFQYLLLEGLSQGADSLIVGDVKQSIYRWRNGDWRILNDLGKSKFANHFPIHIKSLKTNRRSETHIIQFNNRFFTSAVNYLNEKHTSELHEECLPLKEAYADVAQDSPKKEAKGYIKATFLSSNEEHTYAESTLIALGEETQRLLELGIQPSDIAILVRKNKNIPPIASYFEKELHLPIVSDEAFRLDASLSLCILLEALQLLAHPEDQITRTSLEMNLQDSFQKGIPETFTQRFQELRLMPLYELLEALYQILHLEEIPGQDAYAMAFFDATTQYLLSNSSDLDNFIQYWEETLCAKTIPSGDLNGIHILSIHKSKGLEFHTILIPFCDWKLENETNNQLVWCTPSETPYNAIDLIPVTYSTTMAESIYRPAYLQERMQLWVDNLNLLYVAFTRAEKNLILWSKDGQKGTVAELLLNTLPLVAQADTEAQWDGETYELGTPLSSQLPEDIGNHQAIPVHICNTEHTIEFRQSNRSADFIAGNDEQTGSSTPQSFIDRGRLLHTLFSMIETEADIDMAIQQLTFEGIIAHQDTETEIRRLTQRAFSNPQIHDWYSGNWRLFNECEIIWNDEHGKLCKRRPDRVMLKGNDLIVVDFKFGKRRRTHFNQVQEYMRLLQGMGYEQTKIHGYLWYVDQDVIENVQMK